MPRLYLLRHAKAAWAAPGVADFDRPLTPEGMRAAREAGRFLAEQAVAFAAVLCSPALRTRQTLEGVASAFPEPPPAARLLQPLYDGGAGDYLNALRGLEDAASALLVGHNPMTEDFADALAGGGEAEALEAMRGGFPVCGMAVLDFDAPFAKASLGGGTLASFTVFEG